MSKILAIILIIAALVAGGYWWMNKNIPTPSLPTPSKSTDIQNDADLKAAGQSLDNTDIDGPIDAGLAQNDVDSSGF